MENNGGHSPERRKRSRPIIHATSEAKAEADVKRRRVARQDASFGSATRRTPTFTTRSSLPHSEMVAPIHRPFIPTCQTWLKVTFLPPTDHPWSEEVDDPVLFDSETSTHAVSAVATPTPIDANHAEESSSVASLEATPPPRTEESEDIRHLAVALTEQLIRFQGCCHDCHQTAKQSRTDNPHEQIGLAAYLDSTAGLCPDVLSCKTLASQTDNLVGQPRLEARKQVFCGLDPRDDVPHIALDEDERVSSGAGVTFDVGSIIAFLSNLAVAKRGIRWSTRMAVSDLQSNLHLRLIPMTYFDTKSVPHEVHRPVHQVSHYIFGRLVGLEDVS